MTEKTGTKTQLSPSNQEFGTLEYSLQLSLHATTARIVQAHVINNPHLATLFERNCRVRKASGHYLGIICLETNQCNNVL
jgi:hypothetical protein